MLPQRPGMRPRQGRSLSRRRPSVRIIRTVAFPEGADLKIACDCSKLTTRVFEPFATTKGWGSGFGLAKVRHIILSLNGRIICQSEVGRGTTVEIFLPPLKIELLEQNATRPK